MSHTGNSANGDSTTNPQYLPPRIRRIVNNTVQDGTQATPAVAPAPAVTTTPSQTSVQPVLVVVIIVGNTGQSGQGTSA
ncbi:hypothetical protein H1R20_g7766, partial [Candolleomyces eurysporus]